MTYLKSKLAKHTLIGFFLGAIFPAITFSYHDNLNVLLGIPLLAPFIIGTLAAFLSQKYTLAEQLHAAEKTSQSLLGSLEYAQIISKVGSWEFNLVTNDLRWSREHYNIFEIPYPQASDKLFKMYRERIHPDDLSELDRVLKNALEKCEDFAYNHRVCLEGGSRIKFVQGICRVSKDESGKVSVITGTCRDRTDSINEEIKFQSLIGSMNEGFVVQDSTGAITEFNSAALKILGLTADQIQGRTSLDPTWRTVKEDGSDFPGPEHPAMQVLTQHKPVLNSIMGLHLTTGELRWIRINSIPYWNQNTISALTTFNDVTEIKTANDQLKIALEETKKLQFENRLTLELLGIGTWRFNPRTQELHWDQSMYRLFETEEGQFSRHYLAWESALTPESKTEAIHDLELALSGQKEFDTTFEIHTPKGIQKFIGGRGHVQRDSEGNAMMMFGINWDRTQEVELEKKVSQERVKSLHHAKLASLGEMSAGIAHEINNPLTVIFGNLPLLPKLAADPKKLEERIATMSKSCDRIAKIVKGLRKFARAHETQEMKPTSIRQVLSDAIALVGPHINRFDVVLHIDEVPDDKIICDAVEIEQVFINLLNNAADAVKQLPEKWIKLSFNKDSEYIQVNITDSGKGIPAEVEAKLFQPFFTTKPVGEGTGLGLSIVKGILDQHNAKIALIRSTQNTCFEIRFPLAKENQDAA